MQDPLPIRPFTTPAKATVSIPGSKSISNRAFIIAALADGETLLENCLFSRDTEIMIQALRALGFEVSADPAAKTARVVGLGGRIPADSATIDIGNSGTSARFLTAMICARDGGEYTLDGDEAMRRRPIKRLTDTLSQLGAEIETTNGFFPIRIKPRGLESGSVSIDASESSQFVSALLMAAPYAKGSVEFRLSDPAVRRSYIDITLTMMRQFGIPAETLSASVDSYRVASNHRYQSQPNGYRIEADASAASYFFALPLAVGGEIEILGVSKNSMQGDIGFARLMEKMDAEIHWTDRSAICRYDPAKGKPAALQENFYPYSDTFMTAAALAPLAHGITLIEGIAHTRHQECDRIAAMVDGLNRAGQATEDDEASLTIHPSPFKPATIHTYEDHRIAMSFAILGSRDANADATSWIQIEDPLCCRKTFPDFFEVLEKARQDSLKNSTTNS